MRLSLSTQSNDDGTRRLLARRWWLESNEHELIQRAMTFAVARSWQARVKYYLDQNKVSGKQPRTQESLSSLLGIDKANLFLRGGHATTIGRFFQMAQHLDVALSDLLPCEVEILTHASAMILRSDNPSNLLEKEPFIDCFVYSLFQMKRDSMDRAIFDLSGLNAMRVFIDQNARILKLMSICTNKLSFRLEDIELRVLRTAQAIHTKLK